jgi:hypothetical protein
MPKKSNLFLRVVGVKKKLPSWWDILFSGTALKDIALILYLSCRKIH